MSQLTLVSTNPSLIRPPGPFGPWREVRATSTSSPPGAADKAAGGLDGTSRPSYYLQEYLSGK